jgi:hypothetical protein
MHSLSATSTISKWDLLLHLHMHGQELIFVQLDVLHG